MENNTPRFSNRHRRATCAALYAVGSTVGEKGIVLQDLMRGLAKHLVPKVFIGLVDELEALRIVDVVKTELGTLIVRGPEYADGLERLRLRGEDLKAEDRHIPLED